MVKAEHEERKGKEAEQETRCHQLFNSSTFDEKEVFFVLHPS